MTYGTYFVRHTSKLHVVPAKICELMARERIAIHYPGDGDVDSRSLDPSDYRRTGARKAIGAFVELARDGGYVWAEYHGGSDATIGFVGPGSRITFEETDWLPERPGRPAVLKVLALSKVRHVEPYELMGLRAARPRQGTICRWRLAGEGVVAAVERRVRDFGLSSLSSEQVESLCAEFLREHNHATIPALRHLLMPVGRTLKDVDIYGVSGDGRPLFAQVTAARLERVGSKRTRLAPYIGPERYVVLFCETERPRVIEGVHVVPLALVDRWVRERPWLTEMLVPKLNH